MEGVRDQGNDGRKNRNERVERERDRKKDEEK